MRRLPGILAVALWPLLLAAGIYQSHVIYAAQQTATAPATNPDLKLPLEKGSTRFAVIGDSGTGDRQQNEIARALAAVDVVADHQDPVERKLRVEPRHLIGDVVLRLSACPGIADRGELH